MAISKTTDRKVFYAPREMSARISAYWHQQMLKSEAEALRQLIEKGLEAWKAEGQSGNGASA